MKKIISAILCFGMLLASVAGTNTVVAADDVMEATVWEDFSRTNVGEKPKSAQVRLVEKEATVVMAENRGAIGGVNSARVSYTSLRGYHNITGDQGFWFVLSKSRSLQNVTEIMCYVKLPISKVDNEGHNWGKSGMGIVLYLGDNLYVQPQKGAKASYMAKDSSTWNTVETEGLYFDFPTGFEGYVKWDLKDFSSDTLKDDIHNHQVNEVLLQFSNMGGQCGDGYVNAIYGVTKDANGTKVRLNGENVARFLATGATDADIASQSKLLDLAMKAEVLQDFSEYPTGYDLLSNGLMSLEHKKDITATLVESVGGVLKSPSIELASKTMGGFHDSDPFYDVKYPAYTRIDNMKAFLFYIKCAKPHPQRPTDCAVRFNLHTEKNGEEKWTLLGNSTVKAMQKGTGVWKSYIGSGDGNGIVYLPADFEGYVMVNIEDMLTDPIADDLEGRSLISSTFQFQAVGGDCGNGYIGPIYMITDMENKNNKLITFNDCEVYSLGTDSYATENDLRNIGPKIGYSYDEFPISNLEEYVSVSHVTQNSAVVSWSEVEKAKRYRVDLYRDEINEKLSYLCVDSRLSEECELKFENLEKGTRYYVVVVALDENESDVGIFEHQRFLTGKKGTKLSGAANITQKHSDNEFKFSSLIMIGSILFTVVLAVTTVVLIIIDKRKRGEKE